MSDYLWEKKGEPDADVARLEAMLGAFAHRPRPLELPAEAVTQGPRPARLLRFAPRPRASGRFAPALLAAAAALVVAAVVVASVFMRARTAHDGARAAAGEAARPQGEARKDERTPPTPVVERAMLEPPPPPAGGVKGENPGVEVKDERPRVKDEDAAVERLPRVLRQRRDVQPSLAANRRQKVLTAEPVRDEGEGRGLTVEAMSAPQGAKAFVESTRLLTKEQLVYALRLTGAKLRDVREKAQGVEGSRQ